jgi:hypothetical protein
VDLHIGYAFACMIMLAHMATTIACTCAKLPNCARPFPAASLDLESQQH